MEVQLANPGTWPEDAEVAFEPPYGFGLECVTGATRRVRVPRGGTARVSATVRALRADEVNLGRPWTLTCRVSGHGHELARLEGLVAVPDRAPGRILYVLTEDCETFDGGETTGDYGALRVLGNANGFMDPEEYRVQMIEKPRALNRIAERHGARWTHFWTTTQLAAARWAATRSKTGAWDRVVAGLEESVREGARRARVRAPHPLRLRARFRAAAAAAARVRRGHRRAAAARVLRPRHQPRPPLPRLGRRAQGHRVREGRRRPRAARHEDGLAACGGARRWRVWLPTPRPRWSPAPGPATSAPPPRTST